MPTNKKDTPKPPKYTRLDFYARLDIQTMLTEDAELAKIARELEVSPSTISREILRNRIGDASLTYAGRADVCAIKGDCTHRGLCGTCTERLCKSCKKGCRSYCKDYVKPTCPTLQGAPWVSNG